MRDSELICWKYFNFNYNPDFLLKNINADLINCCDSSMEPIDNNSIPWKKKCRK